MNWPFKKKEEKEPSLELEGIETKEGEEGEKKKTELSSETLPTDTGVQSPFSTDGPFAGKTEKEVSDMLVLQDMTIKEQSAAVAAVGDQPPPVVEPEPEPIQVTSEEFFADPGKATRAIVSETIQKEMREIVGELRLDMAKGRAKTAWDDAAESIPNLAQTRPLVEARLKQNGVSNPNQASIIAVHDMLVGEASRQGTPIPGMEMKTEPKTEDPPPENRRVIPQHGVSTQPLVAAETKATFEPLDENEARMARERKMTHEQFRALQEVDIADVVKPEPEKVS